MLGGEASGCAWWLEPGSWRIPEQQPSWAPCQQGRENKRRAPCLPVTPWPRGLARPGEETEGVKESETERGREITKRDGEPETETKK